MKKRATIAAMAMGLLAASGCSRREADRARYESREAREKAQKQLEITMDKLRRELRRADEQTREDLDKARDQLHQALSQSERDADKARERLREREAERDADGNRQ